MNRDKTISKLFSCVIFLILINTTTALRKTSCENLIYCQGDLLHVIQTADLFDDSKTFVDMNLIMPPEVVLRNFDVFMKIHKNEPERRHVADFLGKHFKTSYELEEWKPSDFTANPSFLRKISAIGVRNFAKSLVGIWPILGRKIKASVFSEPNRFSIIPVPNGFIAPGGRFREFYYWDSLWICRGLIISDMLTTARDMLDNFVWIVKKYGFIPNGGRIYYLDRSQPPVLTMMALDYVEASGDYKWLKQNLEFLDQELQYWLDEKTVNINKKGEMVTLARFSSNGISTKPRPESYIEDYENANVFPKQSQKEKFYLEIRSGAESGWDFSARWIFDDLGGNQANLSRIETRRVIPVDLNSFLCRDFKILQKFYEYFKDYSRAEFWKSKADLWQANMETLLYDPDDGSWFDYDIKFSKKRKYFYPSNLAPLWAECVNPALLASYGRNATNYLTKENILRYEGGIPTSLYYSGQQWDFPNAWAPLQGIIIFGLEKSGDPHAKDVARQFAKKWIKSTKKSFLDTKEMFEKYNAVNAGVYGGGGEYIVQSGFGWTNGVILELIDYFYAKNKFLK